MVLVFKLVSIFHDRIELQISVYILDVGPLWDLFSVFHWQVLVCHGIDRAHTIMGKLNTLPTRLLTVLILQAAGAGLASPTVLISKPMPRVAAEWLPTDNQTLYRLGERETRSLELNTSTIVQTTVFVTISPCTMDLYWALYYGNSGHSNSHLILKKENIGGQISVFSLIILQNDKYVLELSSNQGGAAVVSVRAEPMRHVRLRLRTRSRRRLSANWDPSPIDPQETRYCVVASHKRNYTSLCAAIHDLKQNLYNKLNKIMESNRSKIDRYAISSSAEIDNRINLDSNSFSSYEGNSKNVSRKKKISRSTKVRTDEDPAITCVGVKTHHMMENLDSSKSYFVSVFGIANDRRLGSLLATGKVHPKTAAAKKLRENVPLTGEIKGRTTYYFKTSVTHPEGVWFTLIICGGTVDVSVTVKGKKLYSAQNLETQMKFFVPAPAASSAQETSDEGSVQFDSSSEEAKVKYLVKIVPKKRDGGVNVELSASRSRWGAPTPELCAEGSAVRELRPRRACRSTFVAFLPAAHNTTDVIRYCVSAREINDERYFCDNKLTLKSQCVNQPQPQPSKAIVQKVVGLKEGTKYAVQVLASNKGYSIPYNTLYVDTLTCRDE